MTPPVGIDVLRGLRFVGGVIAAAVAVAACTPGQAPPQHTTYTIATHPNGISQLARLDSTLQGQANSDHTACFWVEDGISRMGLIWPNAFSARSDPLSVVDDRRTLVAEVGSHVTFGGGLMPADYRGPVMGCHADFDQWWHVDQV
jgi:hypothetical protein